MDPPVEQMELGEGNANSSPSEGSDDERQPKMAKKKDTRPAGAERWLFTWPNYPEDWVEQLEPVFEGCKWIGGYEIAPTTGTPHIQGYVEFPLRVRPIGYKGAPKEIHWGDKNGKPCKMPRYKCTEYCTKEKRGYEGNLKPPRACPVIELYGWQLRAKEQFESEPAKRPIFWWWSVSGCRGKSDFARWLVQNGALICAGKAADMKYSIVKHHEKTGEYPWAVVFDVPRSSAQYLSYTGIEEIKNGVFSSSKYESAPVEMPYCHVFVLANFPPVLDRDDVMSVDRWICEEIP